MRNYSFFIIGTAIGGAHIYESAFIQVKANCNKDVISINPKMPSINEEHSNKYKLVN